MTPCAYFWLFFLTETSADYITDSANENGIWMVKFTLDFFYICIFLPNNSSDCDNCTKSKQIIEQHFSLAIFLERNFTNDCFVCSVIRFYANNSIHCRNDNDNVLIKHQFDWIGFKCGCCDNFLILFSNKFEKCLNQLYFRYYITIQKRIIIQ